MWASYSFKCMSACVSRMQKLAQHCPMHIVSQTSWANRRLQHSDAQTLCVSAHRMKLRNVTVTITFVYYSNVSTSCAQLAFHTACLFAFLVCFSARIAFEEWLSKIFVCLLHAHSCLLTESPMLIKRLLYYTIFEIYDVKVADLLKWLLQFFLIDMLNMFVLFF